MAAERLGNSKVVDAWPGSKQVTDFGLRAEQRRECRVTGALADLDDDAGPAGGAGC